MKSLQSAEAIIMKMGGNYRIYFTMQGILYPPDQLCSTTVIGGGVKYNTFAPIAHDKPVTGNVAKIIGLLIRSMLEAAFRKLCYN
jgi:hypothetical protein